MPAIKFDDKHKTRGWAFIFEHADDAYFRKDRIVLVTPELLEKIQAAGIPCHLVNGDDLIGRNRAKSKTQKAVRAKARN